MKGPGHRYDVDIRRLWECPECKKQIRLPGNVTQRKCSCRETPVSMRLVPQDRIRTFPPRDKIVIPEEYAEPEPEISVPEIPPVTETPESLDEIAATLADESVSTETTAEDSPPENLVVSTPETELGEPVIEEDLDSSSSDSLTVESVESPTEAPQQPTDAQEQPRRKKRRRKRNRKRDRNKPPSDSDPQNSDSNPSPPTNPPPGPSTDSFGSGV